MPKEPDEIALEFEDTENNLKALKEKAEEIRLDGEEKPFDISEINEETDDKFLSSLDNEEPEVKEEEEEEEEIIEEKEEEEEVEEEVEEKEEKKELPTAEEKVKQNILNHFIGDDGKGSTVVRIKGRDFDLKDVSPAELKHWFEFGGGGYKGFEENAARAKEIQRDRELLDKGAEQVSQLMARHSGTEGKTEEVISSKDLQINDLDSDEMRMVKQHIAAQNKEISDLKATSTQQSNLAAGENLLSEIDTLEEEFPLLSKDEVIAMKAVAEIQGKDISTRELAEVCHRHYSGEDFFNKILKASPERERVLKEKHIKEYLAKKGKAEKVGRSSASSTASSKTSSGKKVPKVGNFDDIEAQTPKLKALIREIQEKGEES